MLPGSILVLDLVLGLGLGLGLGFGWEHGGMGAWAHGITKSPNPSIIDNRLIRIQLFLNREKSN